MNKIIVRRPLPAGPCGLPQDMHPVLRRVYAARDVCSAAELDCSLEYLHPAALLGGIEDAVELLAAALEDRRRILIVGDFDADGATSCALAVRALRAMGAADVRYLVPNRFEYGYGLTPEIVAVAARQEPDLIVTVDNGISSIDGVRAARARGMRVLVTDHHLPGPQLPEADAIVNPNLPGDGFPSKGLAGVGVVFYVLLALRARLRETGWFAAHGIAEPNMGALLDLVALGTVADVVPLDRNNRILVDQGLRRIRGGRCCAGVRALLECAGRALERVAASDLGYAVAPRLNAAGRLEDMALGIECLLADEPREARAMAVRLDELNRDRRIIEGQMRDQAMAAVAALSVDEHDALPIGLCLYDEGWHQGVIGILASRVKDRVHRPVIAFAPAADGELRGSARSVPGLHIRDVLDAVAVSQPGLIVRFGGHAMAAGLSLRHDRLEAFQEAFDTEVRRRLGPHDLQGMIYSDGELGAQELGLELAHLLRSGGPWGQGFPEPVFDGRFEVLARRVVAERHLKLSLRCPGDDRRLEAIAFGAATQPVHGDRVRIAYRLEVNEYRGTCSPQLVVDDLGPDR
jgi:single-stranded-DNA-specific exonuclease